MPAIATAMKKYLQQVACVLRPGSVRNADNALRVLATYLLEQQTPLPAHTRDRGHAQAHEACRRLLVARASVSSTSRAAAGDSAAGQ